MTDSISTNNKDQEIVSDLLRQDFKSFDAEIRQYPGSWMKIFSLTEHTDTYNAMCSIISSGRVLHLQAHITPTSKIEALIFVVAFRFRYVFWYGTVTLCLNRI